MHLSLLSMIPSFQTMAPRNSFLHPLLPLLLLSFTICSSISISSASNLLTTNQTLSGDQKLTSEGDNFVLGFFTTTNTSNTSSKFYIGIWYSKVTKLKPVWVANRDTPVSDTNSSVLQISQDGNLVLLDQDKSLIWSTNATISSNSTVAVLGDDGNLVLRDLYNSSKVLWQSIENPTDTWLPGGRISFNKTAGVSQKLISWKNSENPAPGIFSMEIDPVESQYLLKWNGTKTYWNTGSWNGHIFTGVPEMTVGYIYNFDYINNSQESYFNYSLKGGSGTTIISRFVMDVSGQIKMWNWVDYNQEWQLFWVKPGAQCQVIRLCGPFGTCNEETGQYCSCLKGFSPKSQEDWALSDYSGGCSRNVQLQCGSNSSTNYVEPDKFLQISSVRLPEDIGQFLQVGSAADCEQACLSDCSCTAYSYGTNCSLWYGELLDLQEQYSGPDRGGTLYLRLAASELPSKKGKKRRVVLGVVVGVVAACLACVAVVWILVWRRTRRQLNTASKLAEGTLVAFRYSDLQRATKNFSDQLGVGGFGSVFKGVLPDSTVIAVKKLAGLSQGEKQFRTEVSTIGTVQHVNLVRLRGFCSENTQRLLVYDHMPNGSLDAHLFQNIPNHVFLSWSTRYNIALGIARGLVYLHEKCRDCIIHCDIKPENILLDDSFAPKVSDFGLAKLVGRDFSRVLTTMRGTRGYLAPEWISGVPITPKADAYSYGMMLFEIISGRRNTEQLEEEKEGPAAFFPKVAARKLIEGEVLSLLDPRLEGDGKEEEISRVCKVAFWCIQDDEFFRPTMGQVVQILEGVLEVNMPPIPRSLEVLSENEGSIVFFSDSSSNHSSQLKSTASNSSQTKSTSSVSIHQE